MELENRCEEIVHSIFPDLQLLKKTCLEYGAIPSKYRGEIWSLFLCGSVLRDEESFDHINEQINYREIHQISSQILKIWYHHGSRFEPSPHFLDELSDILALYCKRMNLQFHPETDIYLCNILLPLLSTNQPFSRSLASSCFYSLCTSFWPLSPFLSSSTVIPSSPLSLPLVAPTLTYETMKHNLITEKLSSWLRILLSYHFPSLAIHLDSIHPNWEKISYNDCSRVFGEEVVVDSTNSGTPDGPSESFRPGLLPPSWIGSMFAGSFLTSASLLRLWDWCILWDQKFASVYFTISLLGLHEELILQMTAPSELVAWIHSVNEGGIKAFAQCKAFPAASSFHPHDISQSNDHLTPSRLFGDEFDDDDEFHLSPALTNLENHRQLENTSIPLKENAHNRNTTSISVSIGWDGETDDQSDSDDEAAAAFFAQCATSPNSQPSIHKPLEPLTPVEEVVYDTPEHRQSEETYTQDITLDRLEELFLAGWIACTSRLIRNTPTTFQVALSQITEWATARAREDYLSYQNKQVSGNRDPRDPSSLTKPVPVEYQKSDELDHSSHNWSSNTPNLTRERAPSSPGGEDDYDWKRSGEDLNEEPDLLEDLSSRTSESKSKFQLMVETSTIAAEYGKSIWERVSQKVVLS